MRWDANSLSARMLHLLHQFVPDLYSVTLILPTSLRWLNTVFKCLCLIEIGMLAEGLESCCFCQEPIH